MESLFEGWIIGEVLDVLCTIFQEQNTQVCVERMWMKVGDMYDMADLYYDDADSLYISFCGGPPNNMGLRYGTIKHFLMDRFMVAYYRNENKIVNAIIQRVQNERVRILSA
jgi:hypothetical protein